MTEPTEETPSVAEGDRRDFLEKMAVGAGALTAAAVVGFTIDDGGDDAGASPGHWLYGGIGPGGLPTFPTIPDPGTPDGGGGGSTTDPGASPTSGPGVGSGAESAGAAPKFTG